MKAKNVLITGAAGGIGRATAKKMAKSGKLQNIVLTDHVSKLDALAKLAGEFKTPTTYFYCDITNGEEIEKVFQNNFAQPPQVDILINVAGIAPSAMAPLVRSDLIQAKKIFDVNYWGTLNLCKKVLPFMQTNGYGRIINVASISAFMADPGNSVYSASKAAIVQLTRALAKEAPFNKNGPPHDITVNAVAPGIIDTDMAKQLTEKMTEGFKKTTPFGRLGKAEEIADVIFWLAMRAPQFLTGEVIRVDGGFLA